MLLHSHPGPSPIDIETKFVVWSKGELAWMRRLLPATPVTDLGFVPLALPGKTEPSPDALDTGFSCLAFGGMASDSINFGSCPYKKS